MISVVTDGHFFGGSFDELAAVRGALDAELGSARPPLLCKEFILDPIQLDWASAAGADAVLLIARCLEGDQLEELISAAGDRGTLALVEVTSMEELARATDAYAEAVGVNVRDLDTLEMDAGRAAAVLNKIEEGTPAVHMSGLRGPEDVARVAATRADAALVGEALMRMDDPTELLAAMVKAASAPRP